MWGLQIGSIFVDMIWSGVFNGRHYSPILFLFSAFKFHPLRLIGWFTDLELFGSKLKFLVFIYTILYLAFRSVATLYRGDVCLIHDCRRMWTGKGTPSDLADWLRSNAFDFHSEGTLFIPRPGHQLFWLIFVLVFLSTSMRMPECTWNFPRPLPSAYFLIQHLSYDSFALCLK
jgi:hypothetical protein